MTQHDDDFDQDAFEAAFAKEFGRTLPTEPDPQPEPKTVIAMVLTPVAEAEVLARLMGLVKITWPVFASRTGAVAATTLRIDPLAQLTGHTPPEAVTVAQALSRTSEFGVVLLTAQVGEGEDGATGHIEAARYVGGEEAEKLSPGVVLAGADTAVEQVIFGQVAPEDTEGALDPAEVAARPPDAPGPPPPKRRWGRKPRE